MSGQRANLNHRATTPVSANLGMHSYDKLSPPLSERVFDRKSNLPLRSF